MHRLAWQYIGLAALALMAQACAVGRVTPTEVTGIAIGNARLEYVVPLPMTPTPCTDLAAESVVVPSPVPIPTDASVVDTCHGLCIIGGQPSGGLWSVLSSLLMYATIAYAAVHGL